MGIVDLEFATGRLVPREAANVMRIALIVLLLLSGTVLFVRIGAEPVTRSSEDRCYDVARNMLASGDLLVPIHDGVPRLQKPPLYYWMSVASARLAGGLTNGTLRIPSALTALVLLLAVLVWAHSIGGWRLSVASVAALAATLQLYRLGRQGTAEVTLALASTAALMLYEMGVRRRGEAPRAGVALATGVAFLAKATVALMTVALPIVADLAVRRKLRAIFTRRVVLWSLVALVIGAAWYVYVLAAVPDAFERFLADVTRPFGIDAGEGSGAKHYHAPWYYLDKLVGAALPASLLLPVVIWAAIRTRFFRGDAGMRFVALTFVTLFLTMSILPQKQKHYLIQVLPTLSILIGDATLRWWDQARPSLLRWLRPAGPLLSVVGVVFVGFVGWFFHVLTRGGIWMAAPLAAMLALFVLAGWFAMRARATAFLVTFFLAWYGVAWSYFAEVRPWREQIVWADENELPLPDEERVLRVAKEQPMLMDLLGVDNDVKRRRDALSRSSSGEAPGPSAPNDDPVSIPHENTR